MVVLLLAVLGPTGSASAQVVPDTGPTPDPYEHAADSFRNILPPGQNGHANAVDIAAFLATGARPPHSDDQLQPYEDLVYATPGLGAGEIGDFFKDASFGVAGGDVERKYQPCGETPDDPCNPADPTVPPLDHPCDEVTIQRDSGFGVPHIYGGTRDGAMCAAGYVAAEDRLFLVDVLRHAGRAELSEFAGGSEGNREMDREQWAEAPYTEDDLQRQIDQFDNLYGAQGERLASDLEAYVAGLNQYVFEARLDPVNKMPGEYQAVLGQKTAGGPRDFKGTDIVAIASLVGGIFGKGGGNELGSSTFLQATQDQFGRRAGEQVWEDFRSAEDPEAPVTVHGQRFPYQVRPDRPAPGSLAIPDRGTLKKTGVVETSTPPTSGGEVSTTGLDSLLEFPSAGSNALVVSGSESASGHPVSVFGPQTGYFNPQLLMEMDIHGPGLDARGVSFAGTNLYVQLGRGVDYAWSATSAGQDNVDTFALNLCNPGGGSASMRSRGYRYRGRCRPFEVLRRKNEFNSSPGCPEPECTGEETLRVRRTALGLEKARARLDGKPVVYVQLRSTYLHEVDSARGFADFNNPNKIESGADYQRAAHKIGYTFNWLYADEQDTAYFNSGENPERARGIDPNFPVRACPSADCQYEWQDYEPIRRSGSPGMTGNRARYTPFAEHPQTTNQRYMTSWNNKQARGYRASDAQFGYQSLYRSDPLDEGIRERIRGGRTMTLVELVDAMEGAGTTDLRGDKVLPWMLRALGADARNVAVRSEAPCPGDLSVRQAVGLLGNWHEDDAHRLDHDADQRYESSCAIQLMDAWWPRAVRRIFKPNLGRKAYDKRLALGGIDNEPNNHGAHLGSAYQDGFYGYVEKDLRTILGRDVKGEYSRTYCGGRELRSGRFREGSRRTCAGVLRKTLARALETPRRELYDDDPVCEEDGNRRLENQYCYDTVLHRPVGAITQPLIHWINRPTFQQVVEVQEDR